MKRFSILVYMFLAIVTNCLADVQVTKDKISFDKWGDGTTLDFKVPDSLKTADFDVAVKDGKQEFSKGDLNEGLNVRGLAPSKELDLGGVEYEYVWKNKAAALAGNCSFSIAIDLTGIIAYYQPPLDEEMVDPTCTPTRCQDAVRPENVVGSYAFYHATKRDHRIGGINYFNGKHSHLYRAQAVDANGQKVWCEYNKDLDKTGILTTICPMNFCNNATYPVKI